MSDSALHSASSHSTPIKMRALLIGINYIGTSNQLKGCINDVNDSCAFINHEYGFSKDSIRIMTDLHENRNTTLYPTRANIIEAMKWLVEGNTADSRLFLHYSGHGSYMKDKDANEPSGYDQLICPIDFGKTDFITDDLIKKLVVEPLVEGAKLTVLFDDCHSGTALDLRYNYKIDLLSEQLFTYSTYIIKAFSKVRGDAVLFSGCRDEQTSADAFIDGKSQGAMTYSFLEAYRTLKELGKPITFKRMLKHIYMILKKDQYEQDPQLSFGIPKSIDSAFSII